MQSLEEKIHEAHQLHQNGLVTQAIERYLQLLSEDANHPTLLYLMGIACFQIGRLNEALSCFNHALKFCSDAHEVHVNQGVVLLALHQYASSHASFQRGIVLNPQVVTAYVNLGTTRTNLGLMDSALQTLSRAITIDPLSFEAIHNQTKVFSELDRSDEALASGRRALTLHPSYPEGWMSRAGLLYKQDLKPQAILCSLRATHLNPYSIDLSKTHAEFLLDTGHFDLAINVVHQALCFSPEDVELLILRGKILKGRHYLSEALRSVDSALRIHPFLPEAYSQRGIILRHLTRFEEAISAHHIAIALAPDQARDFSSLGNALEQGRHFESALEAQDRALLIDPNLPELHNNRGNVLKQLERYEEALSSFEMALRLKADFAAAHLGRGGVYVETRQLEEAMKCFDQSIALYPNDVSSHLNKGLVLQQQVQFDEAITHYDRVIDFDPNCGEARFNKSCVQLLLGRYKEGWANYEARNLVWNRRGSFREHWQAKVDNLASLTGKNVLIYPEQGLGDVIQFARYAPLLADRGVRVTFEVFPELVTLFETLHPKIELEPHHAKHQQEFDHRIPVMSLPFLFETTLESIPSDPYLFASPETSAYWKETLGTPSRPRVGLVWSGGFRPNQPEVWGINERRNIPLVQLAPLNEVPVDFYSLQKGAQGVDQLKALEEAEWKGPKIIDLTEKLESFADTAGLIDQLDLIISVDTSTAHLAAAMGKEVWLLNRLDTCWRWLLDRQDSPWYPTVTLYRQDESRQWSPVVERVVTDLKRRFGSISDGKNQ